MINLLSVQKAILDYFFSTMKFIEQLFKQFDKTDLIKGNSPDHLNLLKKAIIIF